jgi:hypothetical protein
MQVSHFS